MPKIITVHTETPKHIVTQREAKTLTRGLFQESYSDIDRLLNVFHNGDIHSRHVCMPIDWYREEHPFEERNQLYIEHALTLGEKAIQGCIEKAAIDFTQIDAIFFISSTGIATPSIDARLMNRFPFRHDTKRIPIWGLGCAGGAAGISRAYEYCLAHPTAAVLILAIELCSLTFQKNDLSKSNLIGVSLFSDGAACVLMTGNSFSNKPLPPRPSVIATSSPFLPQSEEVMGWNIQNDGLFVVFSRSIPSIIANWLGPVVHHFLDTQQLHIAEINHFVAHPGGKKVLLAYEEALGFSKEQTEISRDVLRRYGNMSSPTVLFVLEQFMAQQPKSGEYGLLTALGPGFCGELVLLQWE